MGRQTYVLGEGELDLLESQRQFEHGAQQHAVVQVARCRQIAVGVTERTGHDTNYERMNVWIVVGQWKKKKKRTAWRGTGRTPRPRA